MSGVDRSRRDFGILRAAAAAAALIGLLLAAASWDGLYDTLDLPQPLPALLAQVGGAGWLGLAWLLWSASTRLELASPAAAAGAIAQGAAAAAAVAWLIFRDPELELGIDTLGTVLLISAAVVLGLLALAQARIVLASIRAE